MKHCATWCAVTQAARFATQLETIGLLAEHSARAFGDLPFAEHLKRAGITSRDWDEIRALPLWEPEPGVTFMRPADVFQHLGTTRRAHELHDKFMAMVVDTSKQMIPEATIESATIFRGGTRSGTFRGELVNSAAMFKSFPVTFGQMHHRLSLLQASRAGRLTYLAALVVAMTTAGLISTQLRQIADGKDPLPMDDKNLYWTALLRGGGLGIYGDLMFQGVNRFGHGLEEILAGPLASTLNDFRNLTLGNLVQAIDGEDTNALPEAIRLAKRTLPGSSLWFAKTLMSRMVFEQMEQAADPRAFYRYRRQINRERDRGGDFFFAPGTTSPQRPPELF